MRFVEGLWDKYWVTLHLSYVATMAELEDRSDDLSANESHELYGNTDYAMSDMLAETGLQKSSATPP